MRFLILSDIHANFAALQSVVSAALAHDAVLCLGDIVGYGVQPNECCDLLRDLNAICLLGNHDAALLGHEVFGRMSELARASIEWTRSVITGENRAFLASLSPYLAFEDGGFEAVHAALDEPLETYIRGAISARPTWKAMRFDLCFFGHTHRAKSLEQLDVPGRKYEVVEREWTEGGRFDVRSDGWKTLVNPGSIGQPRDGNIVARYAIFDVKTREIEIFRADYDVAAARLAIRNAGLPPVLSNWLDLGPSSKNREA